MNKMNYKMLGKTGLKVAQLCLGTMSFGDAWGYGADKQMSRKLFDTYVSAGGNFFDSSANYTNGESEKYLGEFIKGNRDRYVIATKCSLCGPAGPDHKGDPNATGNGRKHLREAIRHSLENLQTDHIDIFYVHAWDYTVSPKELMQTLNDFVRQGLVSYLGISNTPAYLVAECNGIARENGWEPFSVYEGLLNPLARTSELEILEMLKHEGMTMTVWQPLAGAMLAGSKEELERRIKAGYPKPTEHQMKIIQTVNDIAQEVGKSVPQVAINWLRQQSNNIIPIFGANKPEHIIDNVNALSWQLTKEQIDRINVANPIELIYPYDQLKANINNYIYNFMPDSFDTDRLPEWQ